jgi:hypothetical protein
MVTSELRRVRYPFAGRAAAPRVVEPLFLYTPVRCRGFLCLGRGVPYIRFVVVLCVRKCGGKVGRRPTTAARSADLSGRSGTHCGRPSWCPGGGGNGRKRTTWERISNPCWARRLQTRGMLIVHLWDLGRSREPPHPMLRDLPPAADPDALAPCYVVEKPGDCPRPRRVPADARM